MIGMSILLFCTVEYEQFEGSIKFWTTGAFLVGAITSILSGWIGMKVAVYANARVALAA